MKFYSEVLLWIEAKDENAARDLAEKVAAASDQRRDPSGARVTTVSVNVVQPEEE